MLKGRSQQKTASFADFFSLIEKESGRYSVELFPVVGKQETVPRALLILNGNQPENKKNEIKRIFGALSSSKSGEEQIREHQPPGADQTDDVGNFLEKLQCELSRVKKSRLPCSLLLIRLTEAENERFTEKAPAIVAKELEYPHHLICMDDRTLALLLPAQNRSRALRKAHAVQVSLSANFPGRMVIGLAVCMAGEVPEAAAFIDQAQREIRKGEQETGDIFYTFDEQDDGSCQVTAEERAQLLCFVNRGKKV